MPVIYLILAIVLIFGCVFYMSISKLLLDPRNYVDNCVIGDAALLATEITRRQLAHEQTNGTFVVGEGHDTRSCDAR